jgi:hypothetical protein
MKVVRRNEDINNYISEKTHISNSVFSLALYAIEIPLYWYFKRKKKHIENIIVIPLEEDIMKEKYSE